MCGIIYKRAENDADVTHDIINQYNMQRLRGTQGFGFLAINKHRAVVRRAETEAKILKKLRKQKASEILFHHRLPTSTKNYLDSTHPILVSHKNLPHDYFVVHNGIISNAKKLYAEHKALGFEYRTLATTLLQTRSYKYTSEEYNDSEVFAIDFALTIGGIQQKMKADGSIAFIALAMEKKTRRPLMLYYGRDHTMPLTIIETATARTIASEGGQALAAHTLYTFYYDTRETAKDDFTIGVSRAYPSYSTYGTIGYGGNGAWDRYGLDRYDLDRYDKRNQTGYVRNTTLFTPERTSTKHGYREYDDDASFRAVRLEELSEKIDELYQLLKIAIEDKQADERAWILEDIAELEDEVAYLRAAYQNKIPT